MVSKEKNEKKVSIRLRELIQTFSPNFWLIEEIRKKYKSSLDDCWVTLPHLYRLRDSVIALQKAGEAALEEIMAKIKEFEGEIKRGWGEE